MHTVNEFFFIPDADHLIATHLPEDPRWQLLERLVTLEEFGSSVYLRDRFFQLGLALPDKRLRLANLTAPKGQTTVTLQMPPDRAAKYDFRYLLFKSKQANDSVPYERYVLYQKKTDTVTYTTRFAVAGLFKLDVFGLEMGKHETYDLVCSYLIECKDPDAEAQLLPDCPDIGWVLSLITDEVSRTICCS